MQSTNATRLEQSSTPTEGASFDHVISYMNSRTMGYVARWAALGRAATTLRWSRSSPSCGRIRQHCWRLVRIVGQQQVAGPRHRHQCAWLPATRLHAGVTTPPGDAAGRATRRSVIECGNYNEWIALAAADQGICATPASATRHSPGPLLRRDGNPGRTSVGDSEYSPPHARHTADNAGFVRDRRTHRTRLEAEPATIGRGNRRSWSHEWSTILTNGQDV